MCGKKEKDNHVSSVNPLNRGCLRILKHKAERNDKICEFHKRNRKRRNLQKFEPSSAKFHVSKCSSGNWKSIYQAKLILCTPKHGLPRQKYYSFDSMWRWWIKMHKTHYMFKRSSSSTQASYKRSQNQMSSLSTPLDMCGVGKVFEL